MEEEFDTIIDFNLKKLETNPYRETENIFTYSTGKLFPPAIRKRIVQFMEDENLIRFEPTKRELFDLSEKGHKINSTGGWLKYLENQKEIQKREEQKKYIEAVKLQKEVKLLNWQVKTFWPLFILAIIGGVYGLYDFISGFTKEETVTKSEMKRELLQIKKTVKELKVKTK